MFQLTKTELDQIQVQLQNVEESNSLRLQNATLNTGRGQHSKYLPYAFTEQGVAMLSGILHSDKAIHMNIAIMRAFVEIRRILLQPSNFKEQLLEMKHQIGEHYVKLSQIYEAIENLLDENASQRKWNERPRIGFKK